MAAYGGFTATRTALGEAGVVEAATLAVGALRPPPQTAAAARPLQRLLHIAGPRSRARAELRSWRACASRHAPRYAVAVLGRASTHGRPHSPPRPSLRIGGAPCAAEVTLAGPLQENR